ncbi:MAG: Z1 domain-containing protein [Caldilineaceae bacterium]|nr:Z1 domain-containing protein [Caldilineaceae bacterium]
MDTKIRNQARILILGLLASNTPTEEELREAVDDILPLISKRHEVAIDAEELVRIMQAEFNVFQADPISLDDSTGHVEWLSERRASIRWHFWERYLRYLQEEVRFPPLVLQRMDSTTQRILGKLEDPNRADPWDRRGMVVGQIQSGKTSNYTGLICRAVDAGYRLVIVLAGMHNSLRSQTQLRLDEGFLGFDTQRRQMTTNTSDGFTAAALGVGRLIGEEHMTAASLTTSEEQGDFGIGKARGVGIRPGDYPVLLVVKKNSAILKNLREWLLNISGRGDPPRIRDFPILVIDDEADNASINTKASEDDPTKVNEAIRKLLSCFDRRAYVGYTATPYANIYINPTAEHEEFGPDLFPASFIEYLRPPTNYFGPSRLFGSENSDVALPLFRQIRDEEAWIPNFHKNGHVPGPLPDSVRTAIYAFVLARATRLARGEIHAHNSMLIHVTRFTSVQAKVRSQVEEELELLKSRIKFGDGGALNIRTELMKVWHDDFLPTTEAMAETDYSCVTWEEIDQLLTEAVDPIVVKTINGTAADILDYFEHRTSGLNTIVIGGDKLSRGLTLEGLTVSYYLRASRAFDTLLQMGRWFGYRPGYEDLCRLWTSETLWNAYGEVTLANEELIREFEEMAALQQTPSDYGLKVRDSVEGMLVTAANKMRAGRRLRVGFAGSIVETTVLPADRLTARENLRALRGFVEELNTANVSVFPRPRGNFVWEGVPGRLVAGHFFDRITTVTAAYKAHAPSIAQYVRNRLHNNELTEWTVALISNPGERVTMGQYKIGLTKRSLLNTDGAVDRLTSHGLYRIRRILNPIDEAMDFTKEEQNELLAASRAAWVNNPERRRTEPSVPSGPIIRRLRPTSRGLLLIYLLEAPSEEHRDAARPRVDLTSDPLVGFAVSFPASQDAPAMEYVVNQRFIDELFGAGDDDDEV